MIEQGMIGLEKDPVGIFGKLIMLFTGHKFKRSQLTHSFIMIQDIYGEPAVLEAKERVHTVPFDKFYRQNTTSSWVVFRIKPGLKSKVEITNAAKYAYKELAGSMYGFLQLLWFPYRWFLSLFGIDVRHQKNWMTNGVICSEVCYWFLYQLGDPFTSLLKPWNPDTIQAQDILDLIQSNKELFELVEIQAKDDTFKKAVSI